MKNLLLLLIFASSTLAVSAQAKSNNKNFSLLVDGKQYRGNDTLSKSELMNMEKSQVQVVGEDNKKYQPVSYQVVISTRDISNKEKGEIWKVDCSTNPPAKNTGESGNLSRALDKSHYGDIVFIDNFKFATTDAGAPSQIVFYVK